MHKQPDKQLTIIGRSELVDFPLFGMQQVPSRIDTGAKTSSIWASDISEEDGVLRFTFFDESSDHHNGHEVELRDYTTRVVASSNGVAEERYVVRLTLKLSGRKIRAAFTLANRASQAYPVLIGRNVLRGKFLVDVSIGTPDLEAEKLRSTQLQTKLTTGKERI